MSKAKATPKAAPKPAKAQKAAKPKPVDERQAEAVAEIRAYKRGISSN